MKNIVLLFLLATPLSTQGQNEVANVRKAPEVKDGIGPFTQLIIRGVTLIDGTGAPPVGPVDIVVKQNRIVRIETVGYPGVPVNSERRPRLEDEGKELDCSGMYLMPGFIDMHGHIGGSQAPIAEYVFKLWMAHGITTVRGQRTGLDAGRARQERKESDHGTPHQSLYGFWNGKQRADHYPRAGAAM